MANFTDLLKDLALAELDTNGDRLDICSTEPTTYTEAITTYSLGNKTGITIAAPSDRGGGGREVVVSAITDGSVTADGTAAFWSIVRVGNTTLLATGSLSSSQAVTNGNTFTLTSFAIGIPDAA